METSPLTDASTRKVAFDLLWRQNMPLVYAFLVRRVRDEDDALDITSDVFAVAWQKLDPEAPHARAWLLSTAWNKLKDYYRTGRRRDAAMDLMFTEASASDAPMETSDRLALRDAIRELGARERQMVLLFYWDGLAADEIATVLSCKPGAVWTALSRARRKLRDLLADDRVSPGEEVVDAHR